MKDFELLWLAAKAIGLPMSSEWDCAAPGRGIIIGVGNGDLRPWNPLENDGEALQLAMHLNMTVRTDGRGVSVSAEFRTYKGLDAFRASGGECSDQDKGRVVRRQIVRVAAMIGKICHHA